MKLAKQFIKAQGGFTMWEVEQHYQPLMSQCKTPDELGVLLEEWRSVRAGYVSPWMEQPNKRCTGLAEVCPNCNTKWQFHNPRVCSLQPAKPVI